MAPHELMSPVMMGRSVCRDQAVAVNRLGGASKMAQTWESGRWVAQRGARQAGLGERLRSKVNMRRLDSASIELGAPNPEFGPRENSSRVFPEAVRGALLISSIEATYAYL